MKKRRGQFSWGTRQAHSRLWSRIALLLVLTLTSHSLDSCEWHLGMPESSANSSTQATHLSEDCQNTPNFVCSLCTSPTDEHPDLCQVVSEVATTNSGSSLLKAPPVILATPYIVVPIRVESAPLPGVMRSRDGPSEVPSLVSIHCRNSLLGRAPPVIA